MNISLQDFFGIEKRLIDLLGEDFIKDQIEPVSYDGLSPYEIEGFRSKIHPFVSWWNYLKKDIKKSKLKNRFFLSNDTIRAIHLWNHLENIAPLKNSSRIINSIKDKTTFYSSLFEARVAAEYKLKNFEIEIIPEVNRHKTPDFKITAGKDDVFIECKSLDSIFLKEKPYWDQIITKISKSLISNKKNWMVTISSSREISHQDINFICAQAIRNILNGDTSTIDYKNNGFVIQFKVLSERNVLLTPKLPIPECKIGLFLMEAGTTKEGKRYFRNPHSVIILPSIKTDVTKRIISAFKTARKQIPKNSSSIIHIEAPFLIGGQLLNAFDHAFDDIYNKLNNDTERVNAVVLMGTAFDDKKPGVINHSPFNYYQFVVPNMNATQDLPCNFAMIGSQDLGFKISDKEGTVVFDFIALDTIYEGKAYKIVDHVSVDGKYQFFLWQLWDSRLRMDIFTPSLGRISITSDKTSIKPNENYLFIGTWSKNQICIYLNKKLIGKNKLSELIHYKFE